MDREHNHESLYFRSSELMVHCLKTMCNKDSSLSFTQSVMTVFYSEGRECPS
jgi:hypothetical protein